MITALATHHPLEVEASQPTLKNRATLGENSCNRAPVRRKKKTKRNVALALASTHAGEKALCSWGKEETVCSSYCGVELSPRFEVSDRVTLCNTGREGSGWLAVIEAHRSCPWAQQSESLASALDSFSHSRLIKSRVPIRGVLSAGFHVKMSSRMWHLAQRHLHYQFWSWAVGGRKRKL